MLFDKILAGTQKLCAHKLGCGGACHNSGETEEVIFSQSSRIDVLVSEVVFSAWVFHPRPWVGKTRSECWFVGSRRRLGSAWGLITYICLLHPWHLCPNAPLLLLLLYSIWYPDAVPSYFRSEDSISFVIGRLFILPWIYCTCRSYWLDIFPMAQVTSS